MPRTASWPQSFQNLDCFFGTGVPALESLDFFLAAGVPGVEFLDCFLSLESALCVCFVGARGVGISQARFTVGVLGQESSDAALPGSRNFGARRSL